MPVKVDGVRLGMGYPLTFPSDLRRRWVDKDLRQKWFRQYQGIITARKNVAQPRYGFLEWYTALHYWETYGLRAAIGYRLQTREDAQDVVKQRVGRLWTVITQGERGGWPDLFIYDPEKKTDWFFVETKGADEAFTPAQLRSFPRLRHMLRQQGARRPEIVIVRVMPQPGLPSVRRRASRPR